MSQVVSATFEQTLHHRQYVLAAWFILFGREHVKGVSFLSEFFLLWSYWPQKLNKFQLIKVHSFGQWATVDCAAPPTATRPGSDLRFWNSTDLKLFQLTVQLSWNLFFQLTSKFCDSLFDLGLNGTILMWYRTVKENKYMQLQSWHRVSLLSTRRL